MSKKITKGIKAGTFNVQETKRQIVSRDGAKMVVHGVRNVDNSGTWTRLETADEYVIINPANVLAYVVPLDEKVR